MSENAPDEQPEIKHPFQDRYSDMDMVKVFTAMALTAASEEAPSLSPKSFISSDVVQPVRHPISPEQPQTYFSAN